MPTPPPPPRTVTEILTLTIISAPRNAIVTNIAVSTPKYINRYRSGLL